MAMQDQPSQSASPPASTVLFLGLFLLLLAFFILLNAISVRERPLVEAVVGSVASQFTSERSLLRPVPLSARLGPVLAVQDMLSSVRDLIRTAIPVSRIQLDRRSNVMRVTFPVDSLFEPGRAHILARQDLFLERLAEGISQRPLGWRFEVEFLIGSDPITQRAVEEGRSLEIRRAGVFARDLRGRGVVAASIAAGVQPGDSEQVEMYFRVRSILDAQTDLGVARD